MSALARKSSKSRKSSLIRDVPGTAIGGDTPSDVPCCTSPKRSVYCAETITSIASVHAPSSSLRARPRSARDFHTTIQFVVPAIDDPQRWPRRRCSHSEIAAIVPCRRRVPSSSRRERERYLRLTAIGDRVTQSREWQCFCTRRAASQDSADRSRQSRVAGELNCGRGNTSSGSHRQQRALHHPAVHDHRPRTHAL